MITSLARYALATAAAAAAFGGIGAIAAAPAQANGFSATYMCIGPMGAGTVALEGWLASPGRTVVSRPTGFRLHIRSLSLQSPMSLTSWNASARIDVSGAENSAFRLAGTGGFVPAGQPIAGDLVGSWAPLARGPHLLSVGALTIHANTPLNGPVRAHCVANEPRPTAETLAVFGGYHYGWTTPIATAPYQQPIITQPYQQPILMAYHGWGHRFGDRNRHWWHHRWHGGWHRWHHWHR